MKKMFSLLVSLCVLAYCILIPAGISAESVNLALASAGTKVTASGSIKGKDLSNINDGDNIEEDLGAWWSNNAAGNMWLEFDLGKIAIIDQIAFYAFNMGNIYTTSVKTSIDGPTGRRQR